MGQVLILQLVQLILRQQRAQTGGLDLPVQLFMFQDVTAETTKSVKHLTVCAARCQPEELTQDSSG